MRIAINQFHLYNGIIHMYDSCGIFIIWLFFSVVWLVFALHSNNNRLQFHCIFHLKFVSRNLTVAGRNLIIYTFLKFINNSWVHISSVRNIGITASDKHLVICALLIFMSLFLLFFCWFSDFRVQFPLGKWKLPRYFDRYIPRLTRQSNTIHSYRIYV